MTEEKKEKTKKYVLLVAGGILTGTKDVVIGSWVVKNSKGEILYEGCEHLGTGTLAEAEYCGLLSGLKFCHQMVFRDLEIFCSSPLMAAQLQNSKVDKSLQGFHSHVRKLLARFSSWTIEWNQEACKLIVSSSSCITKFKHPVDYLNSLFFIKQ